MDRGFLSHLKTTSAKCNLSPSNINLEITESVFLSEDRLCTWLTESRADGFKIVLDDFGTGYSSLSYLSKYPIDKVKVDKSFVNNMVNDPNARAIIQAVVGIASAMDMQIVVEGIETAEQHQACLDLGCDYGQGYLFSRPLDFSAVVDIL
jgi:EAL domain-containing protein (putative c-di-GMP-specific phosphodiesterase class I)